MIKSIFLGHVLITMFILSISYDVVKAIVHSYSAPQNYTKKQVNQLRSAILERINFYRREHNILPVTANNQQLDYYAQESANLEASASVVPHDSSYNIIIAKYNLISEELNDAGKKIIDEWYSQMDDLDDEDVLKGFPSNSRSYKLTQLLWFDSNEIGVGAEKQTVGYKLTVVAVAFNPPGNIRGQFKENLPDFNETTKNLLKHMRSPKETKETKDTKATKNSKENKDTKATKDSKETKDTKETEDSKETKDTEETKDSKENEAWRPKETEARRLMEWLRMKQTLEPEMSWHSSGNN